MTRVRWSCQRIKLIFVNASDSDQEETHPPQIYSKLLGRGFFGFVKLDNISEKIKKIKLLCAKSEKEIPACVTLCTLGNFVQSFDNPYA